ncbi:MAG: hypothetical protein ACK55I_42475, partial [bacterium]
MFAQNDVMNEFVFLTNGIIKIDVSGKLMGFSTTGYFIGDFEFVRNTISLATYTAVISGTLLSLKHS